MYVQDLDFNTALTTDDPAMNRCLHLSRTACPKLARIPNTRGEFGELEASKNDDIKDGIKDRCNGNGSVLHVKRTYRM